MGIFAKFPADFEEPHLIQKWCLRNQRHIFTTLTHRLLTELFLGKLFRSSLLPSDTCSILQLYFVTLFCFQPKFQNFNFKISFFLLFFLLLGAAPLILSRGSCSPCLLFNGQSIEAPSLLYPPSSYPAPSEPFGSAPWHSF